MYKGLPVSFHKHLNAITPYEAGKPIELVVREYGVDEKNIVKLASNENPLGPSPKALEAIRENAFKAHLYPDDSMFELKASLAKRFGVASSNLIIGAGSDQILEFISRALLDEKSAILTSAVTFAMYEIYAKQQGAKVYKTFSYIHKLEEFQEAIEMYGSRIKIVYLCTPNNPTGDALKADEVEAFLEMIPSNILVVIDGAYMEYAAFKDSACSLEPKGLIRRPNVVYLGTFSKAYGLGGMRVGYAIASEEIVRTLYKLRPPFNITTLSLAAAIAANGDDAFIARTLRLHAEELLRYEAFAKTHALGYIESYTNFITYLLDAPYRSSELAQALLEQGVIVRDLAGYGLNALRITVGTPEQNDIFFERFFQLLQQ